MSKNYPISVTILCVIIVAIHAMSLGNPVRQETAFVITLALMALSILIAWMAYGKSNETPVVDETPAEPDEIRLKITVRNNRDGKDFTYTSDNQYGLNYSYEYDRRGQEFLRITKETKNDSLTLAILTEHDVTDVKYGFGTPETV